MKAPSLAIGERVLLARGATLDRGTVRVLLDDGRVRVQWRDSITDEVPTHLLRDG